MKNFLNYAKNRFLYNALRILIIAGIGFMIGSCEVKADSYWGPDLTKPTNAYFYDCTSAGCNTDYTSTNGTGWVTYGDNHQIFWAYQPTLVANSYGIMSIIQPKTSLVKDVMYSVTYYLCTGSSTIVPINLYNGETLSQLNSRSYLVNKLSTFNNSISVTPYAGYNFGDAVSDINANSCRAINYIFVPTVTTNYLGLQYTLSNSWQSNQYLIGYEIESLGNYNDLSQSEVNNIVNNQTTIIQNDITNMQDSISSNIQDAENSINSNIDDMEQSIIDSNKETQDVIKDQFNSCRDSYNLLPFNNINFTVSGINFYSADGDLYINGTATSEILVTNQLFLDNLSFTLEPGTYTFSQSKYLAIPIQIKLYDDTLTTLATINSNSNKSSTFTITETTKVYVALYINKKTFNNVNLELMLNEGTDAKTYEPMKEICTNKLDEASETRKGIWQTIKDLPNQFLNMLKSLFIPEDGYFEEWFNDLSSFFEEKLGFLATPFTIIIDFINRYLELDASADIIINIPDITVPNFEDNVIIHATSFNWSETLKSKEALNTLWQLYLSFIDVYLILNFINFCENKYNRIFGGDTTQYEYYTVEDSYTYDNNTGEVLSSRRNERTTKRKKVN